MTEPFELLYYRMQDGQVPYRDWLETVTDPVAYAAVQSRMDLKRAKNFWEDYGKRIRFTGRTR